MTEAGRERTDHERVIRSGRAAQWFDVRPPYVPGNGVAGKTLLIVDGAAV